jgi:hypothetical protein
VVVRNDMIWELVGAARPSALVGLADADPGLSASALYGPPGLNVAPSEQGLKIVPSEAALAPLVRYAVKRPAQPVRAFPTDNSVLVVGDNGGTVAGIAAGLIDGDRTFRLAPGLTASHVQEVLRGGGRILLTDSNRRRSSNDNRLNLSGPLLAATAPGVNIRTLGKPYDATVAAFTGVRSVLATSSGSVFGPQPSGRPFLAVDGDPGTAWQFGDFGSAVGQSITLRLDRTTDISHIRVRRPAALGARVTSLAVHVGGVTRTLSFGDRDSAVVRFPAGSRGAVVRLQVTAVSGRGVNQVGISEIRVPHVTVHSYAKLPTTLEHLLAGAGGPALRRQVRQAPLDVSFTRAAIEQEHSVDRIFSLPDRRDFSVRGEVQKVARTGRSDRCRTIGHLDDEPVRARLRSEHDGGRFSVTGCNHLHLTAGSHRFVSGGSVVVDRLLLHDVRTTTPAENVAVPTVRWQGQGTTYAVRTGPSDRDFFVYLADGYDSRWRASIDGKASVAPVELNGFGMAWRVPSGGAHEVHISYGPQHRFVVALAVSVSGVGICVVAVVGGWVLRRRARA